MKIPETTANVGAYYGNEENGQWQPNGVIVDSGVGGGVVGSGDAGIHRPPVYPVHIPRGHMSGYVMAGAYFPAPYPPVPAPVPDDFADYMWMENEEEFDKQVMQQLEEEALMEQCIEAMLEDEQREKNTSTRHRHQPTTSNGSTSLSLEETVSRSTLNPLAAEFVPTGVRLPPVAADIPEEKPASQPQDTNKTEELTEPSIEDRPSIDSTEDPQPPKDPPEVSAADVQPIDSKRPKEPRDPKESRDPKAKPKEVKKSAKVEAKKTRPVVVKSETKVPQKKKDVKAVKSEVKLDEEDITKPQPSPTEEATPVAPGIKPINYAAAAKANKPKKASTPPVSDKSTPPPQPKPEKTEKKPLAKAEKPTVQRKNSAK